MTAFLSTLARAAKGTAATVVFRVAPVALWLVLSRRFGGRVRLAAGVGVAISAALIVHADPGRVRFLVSVPVVMAYLALAALALRVLASRWSLAARRRGAALVVAALVFLVAPAFALRGRLPLGALVLGWEAMLSAHSIHADPNAGVPRWRDYLFFLLVNPTVVYRERGDWRGPPRLAPRGLARMALGGVAMLGHDAIVAALVSWPRLAAPAGAAGAAAYFAFVRTNAVLALALYCAHSGLASLQIGALRCVGLHLPERYRHPFLATSPQDFWLRWNRWIGRWGYHHVFLPVGRAVSRARLRRAAPVVAALATFAVIGLLHDLGIYVLRGVELHQLPALRMTIVFAAAGATFAGFRVLTSALRRLPRPLAGTIAWTAWAHVGFGLAWLAIPVLRDNQLPAAVERLARALGLAG